MVLILSTRSEIFSSWTDNEIYYFWTYIRFVISNNISAAQIIFLKTSEFSYLNLCDILDIFIFS